jgi:hypothetical protein
MVQFTVISLVAVTECEIKFPDFFEAVMRTEYLPFLLGFPLIKPVLEFTVIPFGKPLAENKFAPKFVVTE